MCQADLDAKLVLLDLDEAERFEGGRQVQHEQVVVIHQLGRVFLALRRSQLTIMEEDSTRAPRSDTSSASS